MRQKEIVGMQGHDELYKKTRVWISTMLFPPPSPEFLLYMAQISLQWFFALLKDTSADPLSLQKAQLQVKVIVHTVSCSSVSWLQLVQMNVELIVLF